MCEAMRLGGKGHFRRLRKAGELRSGYVARRDGVLKINLQDERRWPSLWSTAMTTRRDG